MALLFEREGVASVGDSPSIRATREVIWLGSGEANMRNSVSFGDGVYKSVDGGRTWQHLGLRETEHIARVMVDPADSNTAYVAPWATQPPPMRSVASFKAPTAVPPGRRRSTSTRNMVRRFRYRPGKPQHPLRRDVETSNGSRGITSAAAPGAASTVRRIAARLGRKREGAAEIAGPSRGESGARKPQRGLYRGRVASGHLFPECRPWHQLQGNHQNQTW